MSTISPAKNSTTKSAPNSCMFYTFFSGFSSWFSCLMLGTIDLALTMVKLMEAEFHSIGFTNVPFDSIRVYPPSNTAVMGCAAWRADFFVAIYSTSFYDCFSLPIFCHSPYINLSQKNLITLLIGEHSHNITISRFEYSLLKNQY
jgi:hypothetical protein